MRQLLLLFAFLLLPFAFPSKVLPAPAYVSNGHVNGNTDPLSFSYDAAGTDFLLLCVVDRNTSAAATATFNGVNMPSVTSLEIDVGELYLKLFQLVGPSLGGSHFVTVSNLGLNNTAIGVIGFSGVDGATPLTTVTSGGGGFQTDLSISISSTITDLVADCLGIRGDSGVLTITNGSQTERVIDVSGFTIVNGTTQTAGSSSTTMVRAWDGTFQLAGMIGVAIKAAGAAPPVARRRVVIVR